MHDLERRLTDANALLRSSPFAVWLCTEAVAREGALAVKMNVAEHHIGNPFIRAIQGGIVASLMDYAAAVRLSLELGRSELLRPLSCNVSYLRSAVDRDCFADAEVVRIGRRIATLSTRAWQGDIGKPCAVSEYTFVLA